MNIVLISDTGSNISMYKLPFFETNMPFWAILAMAGLPMLILIKD